MNALVTGANGLIGSNLVRRLLRRGDAVRALVRPTSDVGTLEGLDVNLIRAEVTQDLPSLTSAAEGVDTIFHTAVRFAYRGPGTDELEQTALSGTQRVLEAAHHARARRVVVTSSSVVFGYSTARTIHDEESGIAGTDDEAAYVAAKIRQDRNALDMAERLGVEIVLVCPTMSVGPHGSRLVPSNGIVVSYLNDAFRCTYPGGCNIVSVIDVADGHLQAAEFGEQGAHYILGSENLEWHEIHTMIADLCGVSPPQARLNRTLSYLASATEELRAGLANRQPTTSRDQASMVGRFYWYSHEKASRLGYAPRPARSALAEAVSDLAMGPHVTRQVRSTLRLHPDVYRARRRQAESESALVTVDRGAS